MVPIYIVRGNEREKRATIVTLTPTVVTGAIVIARAVTAVVTMTATVESEMTIVNDTRVTVDIVMSTRTRSVGDPTRRYLLRIAQIEGTICAKSDRSVRNETID